MLKWIWLLIGVVFVGFVAAVVRWGIHPSAIIIINPSEFDLPEKIGDAAYRGLWQQIGEHQVVIMGGLANDPAAGKIALGFYQQAIQDGRPFQQVMVEAQLAPPIANATLIDFNAQLDSIARTIQNLPKDRRLFIYTVNLYTTHMLSDNPIARLENTIGHKIMTISMMGMATNEEEIAKIDPPCKGLERDNQGTTELGCAALRRSRGLFQMHFTPGKMLMLLDQEGDSDYLMLVKTK